jgi:CRISPR-associated protein Csm2
MEPILFWKDESKTAIEPTLYSHRAEEMAKTMTKDHEASRRRNNRRTQIRKFYDEVVRLDAEARKLNPDVDKDRQRWDDILPLVHMLTAKTAYANGRELVSDNFMAFMKNSVEQITEPRDLRIFATFFEAFMGFYRLHGPSN